MTLGENIKRIRELRKLSVQQLAEKMAVGRANIYNWESDDNTPNGESLTALAKALDVTVDDLLDLNPTSVEKANDNTKNNGHHLRETFYRDLIESNDEYSILPRAVLRDYKIVPDKIIDVIIASNENEKKALEKSKDLQIESLMQKHDKIINGYEDERKDLVAEIERQRAEIERLKKLLPPEGDED